MFPELHQDVLDAISGAMNPPKFTNRNRDDDDINNEYSTNVMGNFKCYNHHITRLWSSKVVAIVIRGYPGNEYSVVVYNQRCRSCNEMGTLTLDENSYVERVAYRLKKWAGVTMEEPFYEEKKGLPHKIELCEGCKAGYCQRDRWEFERYDGET